MLIETRESTVESPLMVVSETPDRHWPTRVALIVSEAFVALTAITGALFVVPTLPDSWLAKGIITPFVDFTIPALALGILCGGTALVALVAVLRSPRLGALASVVAGIFMIGFELVEIVVVGFTAALYPTMPAAWLQVVYLLVGAALAILGLRLWKSVNGSYRLSWPRP
jgi:hypothetical protein